jgi:hypothetical protein
MRKADTAHRFRGRWWEQVPWGCGLQAAGTRVELFDSAGNTRALISVDAQGTPSVALYDGRKARAIVSVMDQGPYVALADEQSRRQITLGAGPAMAQRRNCCGSDSREQFWSRGAGRELRRG